MMAFSGVRRRLAGHCSGVHIRGSDAAAGVDHISIMTSQDAWREVMTQDRR
jgi:hypothetical protein